MFMIAHPPITKGLACRFTLHSILHFHIIDVNLLKLKRNAEEYSFHSVVACDKPFYASGS